MSKYNLVKVPILGQEYKVNTLASPEYIKKIASFVNDKMSEIKDSGIEEDSQLRIAVLAAMNIADDLFQEKLNKNGDSSELISIIEQKAEKLKKKIDIELDKF